MGRNANQNLVEAARHRPETRADEVGEFFRLARFSYSGDDFGDDLFGRRIREFERHTGQGWSPLRIIADQLHLYLGIAAGAGRLKARTRILVGQAPRAPSRARDEFDCGLFLAFERRQLVPSLFSVFIALLVEVVQFLA